MLFITAFFTGLVGSLHCAGMCGPIALATPVVGNTSIQKNLSRLSYNLGRTTTYSILGILFGSFGLSLKLAGFQQSISIISGAFIILITIFSARFIENKIGNPFKLLKATTMGSLFSSKKYSSVFLIGTLNGLLPCGFVYISLTASLATQSALGGAVFMMLFGLGTTPMMFGLSSVQNLLSMPLRKRINKLVPVFAVTIGCLIMIRGMNLGLPYLSPESNADKTAVKECCERKGPGN